MTFTTRSWIRVVLAALVALALVAAVAGCSDDEDSGDGDSGAPTATAVADVAEADLEIWQTDLNAVGCYAGAVDGSLGPQTEAAIRAFQEAKALTVDGRLGPETEGALEDAVAAGEQVCEEVPAPTDTGSEPSASASTAQLAAPSYSNLFTLTNCSLNADVSNVSLRGSSDLLSLTVDATSGTGTLGVTGGDEQDGITLNGDVTSVEISEERAFTVQGTFTAPNNAGEAFTLTGSCPE